MTEELIENVEYYPVEPVYLGPALEAAGIEGSTEGQLPHLKSYEVTIVRTEAERELAREAEQAMQAEIAGIFQEQQQTIDSLDSVLREKTVEATGASALASELAADLATTEQFYAQQPRQPGTGTNFALLIGAGLGLWLLMKK